MGGVEIGFRSGKAAEPSVEVFPALRAIAMPEPRRFQLIERDQIGIDAASAAANCPRCPVCDASTGTAPMEIYVMPIPRVSVGASRGWQGYLVSIAICPDHTIASTQRAIALGDLGRRTRQRNGERTAMARCFNRLVFGRLVHTDLLCRAQMTSMSGLSNWSACYTIVGESKMAVTRHLPSESRTAGCPSFAPCQRGYPGYQCRGTPRHRSAGRRASDRCA